jgi:hypothetical protein
MRLKKAIVVALVTMLFTDLLSFAFLEAFFKFHVPIFLVFTAVFLVLAICSLVVEVALIVRVVCFE